MHGCWTVSHPFASPRKRAPARRTLRPTTGAADPPVEQWRKNLYLAWFAQILTLTGFGFIMPFIPLYMSELGVTDPRTLKLWVGVTAAFPMVGMALAAPFWGMISDRFGRKLMIIRALVSSMILAVALALARSVEAVFIIRMLQGLFAGSVTAATALVAAGTPSAHLTRSLGLLSSATFIGHSLGPLIGGISANLFGFRTSFFIAAGVVAASLVVVVLFVEEPGDVRSARRRLTARAPAPARTSIRDLLTVPFLLLFFVLFLMRFARGQPMAFVPLYIAELRGSSGGSADAAVTGLIIAGSGALAALAGITLGRLGDRFNKLWLIAICSGVGSALALPTFFAPGLASFALFYMISGFAFGGIQPFVQSYLSSHSARAKQGLLFGLQSLVGGLGFGLGPLVASWISIQASTRHVFLSYSLALAAIAVLMLVARLFGRRFTRYLPAAPVADPQQPAAGVRKN